jgi:hypothetical protein
MSVLYGGFGIGEIKTSQHPLREAGTFLIWLEEQGVGSKWHHARPVKVSSHYIHRALLLVKQRGNLKAL